MNFLVFINFSLNFFINIASKFYSCKSFVRVFGLSFFRIFEVFIIFESKSVHPIFEGSFFREHSDITIVFGPSWLLRFSLWFFFGYFLCLGFRLLFLLSLVFREIFLFLIFRIFFWFLYLRFFFD